MNTIEGKCASEGVARGPVFVVTAPKVEVLEKKTKNSRSEIQRFWTAKEKAKEQIKELLDKSGDDAGSIGASIFEAYIIYLDDGRFKNDVVKMILNENASAAYAVKTIGEKYIEVVDNIKDNPRLRARIVDLEDIINRLILCLEDEDVRIDVPDKPSVIVARDLTPSQFFSIGRENVKGLVIERGSYNSHLAILARTYDIPLIINAKNATLNVSNGQDCALYATKDKFIVLPTDEKIQEIREAIKKDDLEKEKLQRFKGHDTLTHGGERIILYANVSSLEEIDKALKNDAEGVGLFRTEYIYLSSKTLPTEEEQFNIYKEAIEKVDGKTIVFRTVDIGGDKQAPYLEQIPCINPSMGSRGIRFSMNNKKIFKVQLRALYKASYYGKDNVKVMYPMLTVPEEIDWIKGVSKEVEEELIHEKVKYAIPEQGVVIETPAAALVADMIAPKVEFMSIGTNDLSQFLYAADRMNSYVDLHDYSDEAMRRIIKNIIKAGEKEGIPVGLCGDLSNNKETLKWVIDAGIKGLSVQPRQILLFRKYIREL